MKMSIVSIGADYIHAELKIRNEELADFAGTEWTIPKAYSGMKGPVPVKRDGIGITIKLKRSISPEEQLLIKLEGKEGFYKRLGGTGRVERIGK